MNWFVESMRFIVKILRTEILIGQERLDSNSELIQVQEVVHDAIRTVTWPIGNSVFTLNPTLKGNGVKSIKINCMAHLEANNWNVEHRMSLGSRVKPGPIDAAKMLSDGSYAAIEWETGNISSSHRAINKLAIGLLEGVVSIGYLILPSREMYKFLTDRVGNYAEIAPYFDVWRNMNTNGGVLGIIEIEHDGLDESVSLIPKGTDGRALR